MAYEKVKISCRSESQVKSANNALGYWNYMDEVHVTPHTLGDFTRVKGKKYVHIVQSRQADVLIEKLAKKNIRAKKEDWIEETVVCRCCDGTGYVIRQR